MSVATWLEGFLSAEQTSLKILLINNLVKIITLFIIKLRFKFLIKQTIINYLQNDLILLIILFCYLLATKTKIDIEIKYAIWMNNITDSHKLNIQMYIFFIQIKN